jgi:hypothetical protein
VEPRIINCVGKDILILLIEKVENIHYILKAKESEVAALRKQFEQFGMLSPYWRCKMKDLET